MQSGENASKIHFGESFSGAGQDLIKNPLMLKNLRIHRSCSKPKRKADGGEVSRNANVLLVKNRRLHIDEAKVDTTETEAGSCRGKRFAASRPFPSLRCASLSKRRLIFVTERQISRSRQYFSAPYTVAPLPEYERH
ncbi:hypothetical protein BaRGS_00000298 [Batillaria attramentaria]|uniref:Uncharacterized protein n=1 Tax=Batillaria attramentaria TaxID=370345 RepID=A0ABD0MC15_9CAEN